VGVALFALSTRAPDAAVGRNLLLPCCHGQRSRQSQPGVQIITVETRNRRNALVGQGEDEQGRTRDVQNLVSEVAAKGRLIVGTARDQCAARPRCSVPLMAVGLDSSIAATSSIPKPKTSQLLACNAYRLARPQLLFCAAYREFMGPFVQMLTGSKLIAAFGDLQTALVMYDTETTLVKSAPGAECVTRSDGRITYSRFVFDRAPFDAARKNGG
jgi:hypothetical protein